jgi:hypothetical protein
MGVATTQKNYVTHTEDKDNNVHLSARIQWPLYKCRHQIGKEFKRYQGKQNPSLKWGANSDLIENTESGHVQLNSSLLLIFSSHITKKFEHWTLNKF